MHKTDISHSFRKFPKKKEKNKRRNVTNSTFSTFHFHLQPLFFLILVFPWLLFLSFHIARIIAHLSELSRNSSLSNLRLGSSVVAFSLTIFKPAMERCTFRSYFVCF